MCSRLVAAMVKNHKVLFSATTQLYFWNVTSKIQLTHVTYNTSSVRDFPSNIELSGTGISPETPLKYGKFVLLINNAVLITWMSWIQADFVPDQDFDCLLAHFCLWHSPMAEKSQNTQ
ncbi:hypothetical protein CROQUDRAFT_707644 [Cronartium quercuum f. sp. fusiforme G11]|uniref:Uncharacterized protein n=1 Tax=Cronartium quercuum f. sp. fusiforme G11 TaxID=708437 RepID=A0A9P6THQ8_9BASI|nr:hypothetical protein CROQUDRAFT_707644 [Cronartium quercuum f. sp. fusiforme G11]